MAVQVTHENAQEVADLVKGRKVVEQDPFDETKLTYGINFLSFGRVMRASENDWIIRYDDNTLAKIGPEEFAANASEIMSATTPIEPEEVKQLGFDDPFAGRARFGTVAGEVSSNDR